MAQPFIGEIRMFAGSFAPAGWMFCDGALLPISENDALFVVLGTTYGGDGQETFALPDLRGRIPIHQGDGFIIGERAGVESVTLTIQQIPSHTHALLGTANLATTNELTGNVPANTTGATIFPYGSDQPHTTLHASSVGPVGGQQPHTNFQPYLCLNFIISLFGLFPSPN